MYTDACVEAKRLAPADRGYATKRAEREGKMPTIAERKRRQDEALDDALAQTFPASDPVALLISP